MVTDAERHNLIIVAVDGSDGSSKATHKAASLARGISGTRLTVVHVINTKDYSILISETDDREAEARATCIINDALEIVNSEGVVARSAVLHGHPVAQIIKYAEDHRADLIVTGSRGLHGAKGMLVGSISEALTKRAKCSVLVVR
ncbi:MAG TPA: universal stress protein [Methanomassiliicoccales archaeon]|jgi:nucleotide-binding universal stress UspA family protein